MSITALIKEVNNAPVIFNVDNLQDQQNLEALQAIKMPESMAAEIFGENAEYADSTTCAITENQDNPAFPYNIVFDSSKIPSKPKRNTAMLAQMAMPSEKFIEIALSLKPVSDNDYVYHYTAPADGYVHWYIGHPKISSLCYIYIKPKELLADNLISMLRTAVRTAEGTTLCLFLPVTKGFDVVFGVSYGTISMASSRAFFHYAKGAI